MIKRIMALILTVFLAVSAVSCSPAKPDVSKAEDLSVFVRSDGEAFDISAPFGEQYDNLDFGLQGEKLYQMVLRDFWDKDLCRAYEYFDESSQTAFNWPYGSFLQMQNAYLTLHPDDSEAVENYKKSLEDLDMRYKHFRSDGMLAYSSAYDAGSDVYYDDNGWIALEFCTAYDMFGDPAYLEKAKQLAEYLYSGWDESEIGGGIWWREGTFDDKNGFTNSPVSILSSWLYEKTGDEAYLDWAKKIYSWVKEYLREDNGLIADSIDTEYKINHTYFTYTTGTTISAAVELYKATGEQEYLDDAKESAAVAYDGFGKMYKDKGKYVFSVDFPNWHGWLLDAFMRLYEFAPKEAEQGLLMFEYALGHASLNARYGNGYYIVDWNSEQSDKQIDLLHQAGTARCLLNVQNMQNMIAKAQ